MGAKIGKILNVGDLAQLLRSMRVGLRSVAAVGWPSLVLTWLLALTNGLLPVARLVAVANMVASVPGVVRSGSDSAAGDRLVAAAVAFVVVIALNGFVRPVVTATAERLSRQVDGRLRERVISAALRPPNTSFLADPAVRAAFDQARGAAPVTGITPGRIAGLLPSVLGGRLQIVALVAGLTYVDWRLGLAFGLLNVKGQDVMQKALGRLMAGGGLAPPTLGYQLELVTTGPPAKEVRVFGLGRWLLDRYATGMDRHMRDVWARRRDFTPGLIAFLLVTAALDAVALVALTTAAARGDVSLGGLTFAVMAIMALNPSGALNADDIPMAFAVDAIDRIESAEAALASYALPSEGPASAVPKGPLVLGFDHVTFRYPGADHDVLVDVDLRLRAGERVALVGANGAGKTTLVRLLCALDSPTSGAVAVSGVDLSAIDSAAWRDQLAVLFQQFARYQLSARDNVRYGAVGWTPPDLHAELDAVTGLTGVRDVIDRLPRGWDSPLSTDYADGASLSGGEWQRVALARALLRVRSGARVLVLDEPTASLDVRGEAELFELLLSVTESGGSERDDLLTVFVSHRFSTVRRADRILVLDAGRIVEDGSHEALVSAGGLYARMFAAQADQFVRPDKDVVA